MTVYDSIVRVECLLSNRYATYPVRYTVIDVGVIGSFTKGHILDLKFKVWCDFYQQKFSQGRDYSSSTYELKNSRNKQKYASIHHALSTIL